MDTLAVHQTRADRVRSGDQIELPEDGLCYVVTDAVLQFGLAKLTLDAHPWPLIRHFSPGAVLDVIR